MIIAPSWDKSLAEGPMRAFLDADLARDSDERVVEQYSCIGWFDVTTELSGTFFI